MEGPRFGLIARLVTLSMRNYLFIFYSCPLRLAACDKAEVDGLLFSSGDNSPELCKLPAHCCNDILTTGNWSAHMGFQNT